MGDATTKHEPAHARGAAEKVVRALHMAGHTAYFAGGCVRDELMGRHPADYDVATDATPQQVAAMFKVAHLVGQAFGVVMVRMQGVWIEVATFRTDVGYSDHRHPDRVEFSDAEHDARRRDFTINGLFYDPETDRVIDYVDGRADIERRVVRAIGRPGERFGEDYLRMLRAVRFAARFTFTIDPATEEAVKTHASSLGGISRERIGAEVALMLGEPTRAAAAHLLHELHLDAPTLDEATVDRAPIHLAAGGERWSAMHGTGAPPLALTLAAWALDRHMTPHQPAELVALVDALDRVKGVQIVRRWRRALVLSNEVRDAMRWLLTTLPEAVTWGQLDVAHKKRLMAHEGWPMLRAMIEAVVRPLGEGQFDAGGFADELAELAAQGVAPAPLVTGDDLVAAGYEPGPAFKGALAKVYDAQLGGLVTTKEEAIELARAML